MIIIVFLFTFLSIFVLQVTYTLPSQSALIGCMLWFGHGMIRWHAQQCKRQQTPSCHEQRMTSATLSPWECRNYYANYKNTLLTCPVLLQVIKPFNNFVWHFFFLNKFIFYTIWVFVHYTYQPKANNNNK